MKSFKMFTVEQKRYIQVFESSLYESYNLEFRHKWLFLNGLFKMHSPIARGVAAARGGGL